MGFSVSWRKIDEKWTKIPLKTNILITHLPPLYVLDMAYHDKPKPGAETTVCPWCKAIHANYTHWGCPDLYDRVTHVVKPRIHVFGHVHEPEQRHVVREGVLFINAAMAVHNTATYFDIYMPRPPKRCSCLASCLCQ